MLGGGCQTEVTASTAGLLGWTLGAQLPRLKSDADTFNFVFSQSAKRVLMCILIPADGGAGHSNVLYGQRNVSQLNALKHSSGLIPEAPL